MDASGDRPDGIDCHGQPFHIAGTSSSTGRYTLENVPCGYRTVNMNKGSFTHQFDVFVAAAARQDGKLSALSEKELQRRINELE